MMLTLFYAFSALAMFAAGWFADGWFQKRKIEALHGQLKSVRQTAAEHANQVRRQIGQLQAELATRPAVSAAQREKPASAAATASVAAATAAATASATAAAAAAARRAAVEKLVPDHGFAQTAIAANHGFATTEVMAEPAGHAR